MNQIIKNSGAKSTLLLKPIIVIGITLIIIAAFFLFRDQLTATDDDNIFYSRKAVAGECPSNQTCTNSLVIYNSGKVVQKPKQELSRLTPEKMDELKLAIRNSDIMINTCDHQMVMDYSVTYTINLDGKSKTIEYPGCVEQINQLNKIIGIRPEQ